MGTVALALPGPPRAAIVMPLNGHGLSVRELKDLHLSPRELQILRLLGNGQSTKNVAAELDLSINTINGYVRDLYMKLGLEDRLALGVWIAKNLPPLEMKPNS